MSEQNTAGVSAPGLPAGATVLESGATDGVAQGIERSIPEVPGDMPAPQQAALQRVEVLRGKFLEATGGEKDKLMLEIAELQRFGFHGGKVPAGLAVPGEPGEPDLRPYDPDVAAWERAQAAEQNITPEVREQIVAHAKAQQLDPADAEMVVTIGSELGLGADSIKTLASRAAVHERGGWFGEPLTDAEHVDLFNEAARQFGSEDRLLAENALARAYLKSIGKADLVEKIAGSMAYDPAVIMSLAYRARSLGLEPITD